MAEIIQSKVNGIDIDFIDHLEADLPRDGSHFIVGDAIRESLKAGATLELLHHDEEKGAMAVIVPIDMWRSLSGQTASSL